MDAQNKLAVMYAKGEGVSKDAVRAVEWFRKAAAQGDVKAQFNLGWAYAKGEGVSKDAVKAVEWFQKAAAQGLAWAQNDLAVMYAKGEGVSKDAVRAVEWFRKAAAQGDVKAQFNLGWAYAKGEGVSKDAVEAVEWFRKAAAWGDEKAQFNLGWAYAKGEGVPENSVKAVEWFQKAAAQGHSEAQVILGVAYAAGEGVSTDFVLAYAWENIAAASGHGRAVKIRGGLESKLSSADKAEGQRLSSNWKKGQILAREGQRSGAASVPSESTDALSKKATGTLFVVSKSGDAVTNEHVSGNCTELRIQGREGLAKLVTDDKVNDLALVRIQGVVTDTATLSAEPGKLRQGEEIVAFGFPLNALLSSGGNLTPGVVSALTGLGNNTNQIQITAPIQPGSSGSPVLNKKGEVVGVVSMKLDDAKMAKATGQIGQNVNFAVSGQTLKTFLDTHKVSYTNGSGFFSMEKSTADLAEEARRWTLVVECWR